MPNYVRLGEEVAALARVVPKGPAMEAFETALSREATALLGTAGKLTGQSEPLAATAQRLLSGGAGGTAERVFVARPLENVVGWESPTAIYERGRNLLLYPQTGKITSITPTPAGRVLRVETVGLDGSTLPNWDRLGYTQSVRDKFELVRHPIRTYAGLQQSVVTTGDTRRFVVGNPMGLNVEKNFLPDRSMIEAVKAAKTIDVPDSQIGNLMGARVYAPHANGWLVGFDKKTGEAIVNYDEYMRGFVRGQERYVPNLAGFHPVEIANFRAAPQTAYRNSLGQLYKAEPLPDGGYRLLQSEQTFAFKPSEVLFGNRTVAQELGVPNSTGLRAMGGYDTRTGGRIPIEN